MTKRMLADVFWMAANRHLSASGVSHGRGKYWASVFSCCAVADAAFALPDNLDAWAVANKFLRSLGCPTTSEIQTFGTKDPKERQQRRYMWLLLAMHAAEDEGIEIE